MPAPAFVKRLWQRHKSTIVLGIVMYALLMLIFSLALPGTQDAPFQYDLF